MKKNYISVIYDEKRTPKTDYPCRLVRYLAQRFDLKNGERLLEIGCGRGDFLTAFSGIGLDCFAVDKEKEGQNMLPGFAVKQCDISREPLPFEDNFFDVVYHKSLIEHLDDPIRLMNETLRVLKPGGKIIVLTPDWVSQMENFYEDYTHHRPYTPAALKDLLTISGFGEIKAETFYQLPSIWKRPFLKIPAWILRKILKVNQARWLTGKTGIKFIRFSVELMILGYGEKQVF